MSGLAERPEESGGKWITVGGRRVQVKEGQDPQEAISEKFTGVGGDKAKNTKEGHIYGKDYVQRYSIFKGLFETRDEVTWDKYTKFGKVAGFDGISLRVLDKYGDIVLINKDYIYKVSELTAYGHWDAMNERDRASLLKECNLSLEFLDKDYMGLPQVAKDIIKTTSPAGYELGSGGFNTGVQGKVNPVNTEQTVSEKIRDEISRRAQTAENTPPKILDEDQLGGDKPLEGDPDKVEGKQEGEVNPAYGEPAEEKPLGNGKLVEGGEPMAPQEAGSEPPYIPSETDPPQSSKDDAVEGSEESPKEDANPHTEEEKPEQPKEKPKDAKE